jgi:hypothetical protein
MRIACGAIGRMMRTDRRREFSMEHGPEKNFGNKMPQRYVPGGFLEKKAFKRRLYPE